MPHKLSGARPGQSLKDYRRDHLLESWSSFPNTSAAAAYFQLTQHIELYSIDKEALDAALETDDVKAKLQAMPTLLHEVRHWLDHVSTLWGQQDLVTTYNAMHSRMANVETEFWRIIEYRRATRRDRFESYFTTINDRISPPGDTRWKWELSCGFGFDERGRLNDARPIVFTRFSWKDGRLACRVPFSVASLLETNAMHFEIGSEVSLVSELPDGEREVETAERRRGHLLQLYNPDLAVYSTAAHLVANRLHLKDVETTYELSSCLATLSLNLPDAWFPRLRIPDKFADWSSRTNALINTLDRGFAFIVLATNAPERTKTQSVSEWCEAILSASNLPSLERLRYDALGQMEQIGNRALGGVRGNILQGLLADGRNLFKQIGPMVRLRDFLPMFTSIGIPPLILSDLSVIVRGYGSREGTELAVEEWINRVGRLNGQFNEFVAACGF